MSLNNPTATTAGYFDPTERVFQIVTPTNYVIRTVEIPENIVASPREKQEIWVRTQIRKTGNRPTGKPQEYPYGFFYNL